MARRRPAAAPGAAPPAGGWHPALAAGPNIETWAFDLPAGDDRPLRCWVRWRRCRRVWLDAHTDVVLPRWAEAGHRPPWSWAGLPPDRLAGILQSWGLPEDWTPAPAPAALLDLPRWGPIPPEVVLMLAVS